MIDDTLNIIPLDDNTKNIAQQLIDEQDLDQVKNLTHLFNLNQAKKNVLRILKLNQLLDKVSDQMIERFEKRPGEFSNADLLNYMQVAQSAIDRANKSLNLVDETPAIQINQQNIIMDKEILDKDSRDRVTDAVNAILNKINKMKNEEQKEDIIELIEEEKAEDTTNQPADETKLLNEEE